MLSGTVNVSKVACPSAGMSLIDADCPIATGGYVHHDLDEVPLAYQRWNAIGPCRKV